MLDDGGIITSIAFGPIQTHDLTLCRDILLKSPYLRPGDMAEFTSTRLVQVLYHVICVLLAYNLSKLYSNTRAGQEFARKTLRQLRREQARSHEVGVLVFVGGYYAVFDIRFFTGILLRLGHEAVAHLRDHFPMPEMGFT